MTVRLVSLTTLAVAALVSGAALGTEIFPDSALGLEAKEETPNQAVMLIGQYLTKRGFSIDGPIRLRHDGFVRAVFKDSFGRDVEISGKLSCLRVDFYLPHDAALSLRAGLIEFVRGVQTPAITPHEIGIDYHQFQCGSAL